MAEEQFDQSRQDAYEAAYYEAAAQAAPDAVPAGTEASQATEQYHADPFVAAMSDATTQRAEGNPYQQPWSSSTASAGQGYSQQYQQAYQQGYQQAYQQNYQQDYTGQQYYTQQAYVRTKDHVAAGLLALFLGSLGVHKFYLGYNNAGFIMLGATILGSLFTFGLAGMAMGIIALIEGIIYLTKPQSVFDAVYVYGHKEWF